MRKKPKKIANAPNCYKDKCPLVCIYKIPSHKPLHCPFFGDEFMHMSLRELEELFDFDKIADVYRELY